MKKAIILLVLISFAAGVSTLSAWPRPSLVSKPGQWTLDVTYEHPRQITVQVPGSSEPQRYWYMIVSLTNNTDQEIPFYPAPEIVTDTFRTVPSGCEVQQLLYDQVKAQYRGSYPFLESQDFDDHIIRQGKDNTRDFVLFWPDFDPKANQIRFFIGGLSNETTAVNHPTRVDEAGNPQKVFLQKTLQLTYLIGVDPSLRSQGSLNFENQEWVMR